jgi:Holliday junction resolvasome RuvABC endonuclease subunit
MIVDDMGLYVGIDPSLNRPGLALLDDTGKVLLATGFSVGRDTRGAKRLFENGRWVESSLLKATGKVLRACIEGPSLGSVHREFDLGEGSGVLKAALYNYWPVEPLVVEPTRLKKFATGNAQADKAEVLHAVKTLMGLDLGDDDDAADAVMLARLAWALDHKSSLKRRCELEVVSSMLAPKPKQRPRLKIPTNV